ncbi:hypothetical protein HAX54_041719 [Datura stramonium]|uniref:Uncharacterized protein n=1 Tax=Datura stramonium TaxID=4076 RepID=A0ABS8SL99_DATST|nr:hypothetical protein [Datura stramonium]
MGKRIDQLISNEYSTATGKRREKRRRELVCIAIHGIWGRRTKGRGSTVAENGGDGRLRRGEGIWVRWKKRGWFGLFFSQPWLELRGGLRWLPKIMEKEGENKGEGKGQGRFSGGVKKERGTRETQQLHAVACSLEKTNEEGEEAVAFW